MARSASWPTSCSCMKRRHLHGEHLRRRHQAVGHGERRVAVDGLDLRALAEPPELALAPAPGRHDHAVGQARRRSPRPRWPSRPRRRRRRRPTACWRSAGRWQPERGRQARRVVAIVAVGGEAVDVGRVDPGVGARLHHGVDRQPELRVGRPPPLVVLGLGHADYRDLAPQRPITDGVHTPFSRGALPATTRRRDRDRLTDGGAGGVLAGAHHTAGAGAGQPAVVHDLGAVHQHVVDAVRLAIETPLSAGQVGRISIGRAATVDGSITTMSAW